MKFSIQLEDINGAPVGEPVLLNCPAEQGGVDPSAIATTVDDQRILVISIPGAELGEGVAVAGAKGRKIGVRGSLNGGTCPTAFYLHVKEESR